MTQINETSRARARPTKFRCASSKRPATRTHFARLVRCFALALNTRGKLCAGRWVAESFQTPQSFHRFRVGLRMAKDLRHVCGQLAMSFGRSR